MRLSQAALLFCTVALVACGGSTDTSNEDAGTGCKTSRDCATAHVCVGATTTQNGTCVPTCNTSNDCTNGQVCEDTICVAPGCGGNSDCTSAQICSGGNCVAPPANNDIQSCVVTPAPAFVQVGGKVQLAALVSDKAGNIVQTGVTWSSTSNAAVDSFGVVTGATAGSATVTATVASSITCTSTVKVYGAVSAGISVVVVDQHTKNPIAGAKVVLDSATSTAATTDASGIASFPAAVGQHDVHVFAADYNYTSFIGINAGTGNLLVPLPPYIKLARRSGFQSTMTSADFANLSKVGEILHLAFFGSGIPGSVLDFSLDTLLGPLRSVTINIGGSNTVQLPSGLVIGLGDDLFGTGSLKIYSEPGKRALWGIGGNIEFDKVISAVGPLLNGGTSNVDVGGLLPQLLPLLNDLQAGSIVGAEAPANVAEGGTPTFNTVHVPLDTPLRLRAIASVPDLPTVGGKYVDGVVALSGASAYPMGFVPLGFSAGLAAKDSNGNNTAKTVDPTCGAPTSTACATSKIPFNIASRNHGLEGYKYGTVLLALNFSSLTSGSTNGGIEVSGIVRLDDTIPFTKDTQPATPLTYTQAFPKLPSDSNVTYTKGTRTLVLSSDAEPTTQIYRFEIENAARQNWNVWMAPIGNGGSARTIVLPDPSQLGGGLIDPSADAVPQDGTQPSGASGRLTGITTFDVNESYTKLTGFNDITLDAIGSNLSSFAVQTVTLH
ncbi:MAG: hypothetical protein JST92_20565 [Deltaproteobacteria bacterium]|nr:hypothetical protein [Deltaproteobacteria bacterium]